MAGNDGTLPPGPAASIAQAGLRLQLAEADLWRNPGQCGPAQMPGLLWPAYQSLAALTSILGCMAGADLDPAARADLAAAVGHLAAALSRLHTHAVPPLP